MTTSVSGASASPYTFNNDEPTAADRLGALSQMLDEFTTRRLLKAGVRPGIRCLEVGAGAGTIAAWLADEVGPSGTVIATDIKPQHVPTRSNLQVLVHNVVTDPLPKGPFEVIHARAVLQHLPERDQVLANLAAQLAPGGALVVEELEANWGASVLATPDPAVQDIFARYGDALRRTLEAAGNDPTWCRRVFAAMEGIGLTDVDTEAWQRSWRGGTGSCLLAYSGSKELRPKLLAVGMAAEELDTMARVAMDPRLVLRGMLLVSTLGRRPTTP